MAIKDIAGALEEEKKDVLEAITLLADEYENNRRGVRLVVINNMVQMASREEYASAIEAVLAPVRKQALSRSILETLSIVAYKQPITRTEIAQIRGVRCDYAMNILLKRELIEEVGRKDALGRPILYGTTELFLRDFNLKSITQLPSVDTMLAEDEEIPMSLENEVSKVQDEGEEMTEVQEGEPIEEEAFENPDDEEKTGA